MRRRTVFACAAALAFVLLASSALLKAESDTSTLEGKPAPDFSLKTLAGDDFKLSGLKGSVVVLDFWATWCPPCRKSLPHLNKDAGDKELADKGLKVFAVNCKEPADKVKAFLEKNSYQLTVPMDGEGATMQQYLIQGIPTTLVIGRDGVIRNVFIGFGGDESEKALDAAIDSALKDTAGGK
jgi:thiol-disulfide isomerase/thioredoxin